MGNPFLSHLRKMDHLLAGAAILLALFGIVELVGMAQNNASFALHETKQITALSIGVVLMYVASFFDYRFFRNNSYALVLLYVLSLAVLAVLLGIGERTRGLVGWFKVGEFAFAPVEGIKIVMALLLAKYFSVRHIEMFRFTHLAVSFIYVLIPTVLILLQPDLGSATIVFGLWLGITLFAGISKKHLALLALAGVLLASFAWVSALKDYQKERIISFVNPYNDPQGTGYNAIQSIIAVGSGGLTGQGLGYGSQVQLGFLPEAHTDFMFASISEEFGLVGAGLVLFLMGVIVWRIAATALAAQDNFGRLFCAGMLLIIFIQLTINMGMNIGLAPVIGITFPFLSYGGSSLVSLFLGLGLVQSIRVRS